MTLPNFLHIGINKAGSSWLWKVCQEHPDMCVPEIADNPNFFTLGYQRGLDWYEKTYFSHYNGEKAVGEFSNSYLVFAPAMERIVRDLPDVKLTCIIRNPVERAFLSWAHQHLKNKPTGLDGRKGIGFPLDRILGNETHGHGHGYFRLYAEPGFYAHHLQRIYTMIPKERVLVQLHEDVLADNATALEQYFSFLGVDPKFQSTYANQDVNPDPDGDSMDDWVSAEFRAELGEVFREDREKLEKMLDRDLSHWR